MKLKSWCLFILLALAVLAVTKPVMAKGPVDKITIEGPGLAGSFEITNSVILSRFDPWGGQFIGTGGPLVGPPPHVKEPYLVKFYLENQRGDLTLRYMFYYCFNPTGRHWLYLSTGAKRTLLSDQHRYHHSRDI